MKKRIVTILNLLLTLVLLCGLLLVGCDNGKGQFYNLQEAYDNGWLTQEDLKSIAFYYNRENDNESFQPKPIHELSRTTERKIKQTFLNKEREDAPKTQISDIVIMSYYGTYGECVIVGARNKLVCYDYLFENEEVIGEVTFYSYCGAYLQVWREI